MHSHLMKTMFTQKVKRVLILVVMEDALALVGGLRRFNELCGLNPCCNGRCTRTSFTMVVFDPPHLLS